MTTRRLHVALVVAGSCLALDCTGVVGGEPGGRNTQGSPGASGSGPGSGGSTGTPGDIGGPPQAPGEPAVESAGTLPLLRLTHREYSNTISALLSDTSNPGAAFETDIPGQAGYDAPNSVATENARQYMTAAETLAASAIESGRLSIPCTNPSGEAAENACVTELIASFGRSAYRRSVTAAEAADLLGLFQTARGLGFDFSASVTHMLEAMLQSPNLLYHWEIGDQPPLRDAADPNLVALTGDQLASRLAYFLWETTPDGPLLDAAASGGLATADGVRTQALRLLAARDQAQNSLFNFHRQWLHIDNLADLLPGTDLGLLLGQELQAFVASVVVDGDGTLKSLLTAPYTFANQTTAQEYGLSVAGNAFVRLELDPAQRQGLLMQVPFLRTNGVAPPVDRGLVVYRQLLCGQVPAPPLEVPELPQPGPTTTTRQRFSEHAELACATGCHTLFDPWGFAFENFDAIGHYRTQENGQAVDASGLPLAGGAGIGGRTPNGENLLFYNAVELVAALAASDEVSWCTSRQWARYMLGRFEGDSDVGAITNAYVDAAFQADRTTKRDFSMRDFLVALVGTKAFRFRTPSAGEPL